MRLLVAALLCTGLFLRVRTASADCISSDSAISVSKATRSKGGNSVAMYNFYVSRKDCLDGDEFTFPYSLNSAVIGSNAFEVWIAPNSSVDCTIPTSRDSSVGATKCILLAQDAAPANFGNIKVAASKIADAIEGVSNCTYTGAGTAPIPTTIDFMLVPPGEGTAASSCAWADTAVDLVGPEAPTDLTAGIGDTIAAMSYTITNNQTDTVGYQFFCDPPTGAGSSDGGAGGSGSSNATATVTSATAGGAGGTAATTAATTAAAGGAGGSSAVTATTGTSSGGGPTCPSNALFAGQIPDQKYVCGKSDGVSGNATGLTNGTLYAIGVAAFDNLGNYGPLSNVVCVKPGPIDDFFSLYRNAGGRAGGCALSTSDTSSVSSDGAGLLVGVGALGLTALRRRRAKRKSNSVSSGSGRAA